MSNKKNMLALNQTDNKRKNFYLGMSIVGQNMLNQLHDFETIVVNLEEYDITKQHQKIEKLLKEYAIEFSKEREHWLEEYIDSVDTHLDSFNTLESIMSRLKIGFVYGDDGERITNLLIAFREFIENEKDSYERPPKFKSPGQKI